MPAESEPVIAGAERRVVTFEVRERHVVGAEWTKSAAAGHLRIGRIR